VDNRTLLLFLSGLAAAGAALCIAVSCSDQPPTRCASGRGPYSAKYLQTSGPDAGSCALPGEQVFLQLYNAPPGELAPGSIAIAGTSIANAVGNSMPDPNTAHSPYSSGKFATALPNSDNFCDVPSLSVAEQDVPERPAIPPPDDAGPDAMETPAIPATKITYSWEKVRLYVTHATQGAQLVGDLTYTVDDCTAKYHVQALFPSVSCAVEVDDAGTMGPDVSLCDPNAAPEKGRPVGSGIGPDLKVVCDPTLLLCVLAGDPPSLR